MASSIELFVSLAPFVIGAASGPAISAVTQRLLVDRVNAQMQRDFDLFGVDESALPTTVRPEMMMDVFNFVADVAQMLSGLLLGVVGVLAAAVLLDAAWLLFLLALFGSTAIYLGVQLTESDPMQYMRTRYLPWRLTKGSLAVGALNGAGAIVVGAAFVAGG